MLPGPGRVNAEEAFQQFGGGVVWEQLTHFRHHDGPTDAAQVPAQCAVYSPVLRPQLDQAECALKDQLVRHHIQDSLCIADAIETLN